MFKDLQRCINILDKAFGPSVAIVVNRPPDATKLRKDINIETMVFLETAQGPHRVSMISTYPFKGKVDPTVWVQNIVNELDDRIAQAFAEMGVPDERVREGSEEADQQGS